ncbi:nucleotide disphospho-sugar-binding domain-containing protein [Micromonospora aurantiaca (nom. illeg.)]|uniref:nucleotide disphospho-sugar-binding domain-containing protein n=1 Tax=Micromonospora aurantiaca (nom. illeg.) TaxID=47850 RepID=UPI0033C3B108
MPYSVPGHVRPMLAVAAELSARGDRVWMLVSGGFVDQVRLAGAVPVRLDVTPDVFVPERPLGRDWFGYLVERLRRPLINWRAAVQLARVVPWVRPDLVVVDPMLAWADRVVRGGPVPSALLSTTFAGTPAALAEAARTRLGWVGAPEWWYRWHPLARRVARGGRLVLANAVPGLQPAAGSGMSLVGPLLCRDRGEDVGWRQRLAAASGRLLFVSPGTVFARGRRFFLQIAESFAGSSWTVVAATGRLDPVALGSLAPNFVACRWAPQQLVLSRADVFVTHGGMNSTLEGILAGVPMVFAPRSAEQWLIAGRCVDRGVGVLLPGPGKICGVIEDLVSDSAVHDRLAEWRAELTAIRGACRAADLLSTAVRSGRSPAGGLR